MLALTSCGVGGSEGGSGEQSGESGGESGGETGGESGGEAGEEIDKEPEYEPDETLYYKKSSINFYFGDDIYAYELAEELINQISANVVKSGHLKLGDAKSDDCRNEITVGYVPEKPISVEAYRLLNELPRESEITEMRYLIYADSGKIAFAYDENTITTYQLCIDTVNSFVEKYVRGKNQMFFEKEIIESETVKLIEKQQELDDIETAERWENVKEKLNNEDTYLSIRNMFETMFDKEMVSLVAKYYDPATGLFYASLSGKEADGIYPITEASARVFEFITITGMFRNASIGDAFSDLQKYKIIYQVKSIQDPCGEFYVAQMPMNSVATNRAGRDRGACLALLNRFGAQPTYSIGAYEGDGVTGEQYWADLVARKLVTEEDKPIIYWADKNRANVTAALSTPTVVMVSSAVANDTSSSVTEPFETHENFVKWLLEKDPYNDPYSSMSATDSSTSLIKDWNGRLGAHDGDLQVSHNGKTFKILDGDTLYDILIRWLNSNINEAGLFGKVTNQRDGDGNPIYDGFFGGWGYQNSNGFLKCIKRYGDAGTAFPEPRLAAESLLKGINSDESVGDNILVVYNVWGALNHLKENIIQFYDKSDKEDVLSYISNSLSGTVDLVTQEKLEKSYAAVAIDKCLEKLMLFKKTDGGFGHNKDQGTPSWQGRLPVGIPSDNTSDMDAINCSTCKLGDVICSFFGINMTSEVPIYTDADLLRFITTMQSQETVIKEGPKQSEPDGSEDEKDEPDEKVDGKIALEKTFDKMPS